MARVPLSLYPRRSRNLVRNAGGILSAGSGRGILLCGQHFQGQLRLPTVMLKNLKMSTSQNCAMIWIREYQKPNPPGAFERAHGGGCITKYLFPGSAIYAILSMLAADVPLDSLRLIASFQRCCVTFLRSISPESRPALKLATQRPACKPGWPTANAHSEYYFFCSESLTFMKLPNHIGGSMFKSN